jgi:hypothetical protein
MTVLYDSGIGCSLNSPSAVGIKIFMAEDFDEMTSVLSEVLLK